MAKRHVSVIACTLILPVIIAAHALGAEIGQIKKATNHVHILRNNAKVPAKAGDLLKSEDTVLTGAGSSVGIAFIDNSRFSMGPNSNIELTKFRFDSTTQKGEFTSRMKRGTLVVISGKIAKYSPNAMRIRTRTSVISVRGTKFLLKVEE